MTKSMNIDGTTGMTGCKNYSRENTANLRLLRFVGKILLALESRKVVASLYAINKLLLEI